MENSMSTGHIVLSTVAFLSMMASCRLMDPGSPVPLEGNRQDVSAVSGAWAGRYSSNATGRHGTIRFRMPEQADTGYGDVEITFSPSLRLTRNASASGAPKLNGEGEYEPSPCTVLSIKVVRVKGDEVRGTIAPYWDPDCDCRAQTVFEGKISGERIVGTFSSRRESSDRRVLTGVWQVERQD
jgi:hypothetical protein